MSSFYLTESYLSRVAPHLCGWYVCLHKWRHFGAKPYFNMSDYPMNKINNIFAAIPKDISDEVFENIAGNDQIQIERIISKGHTSPALGWHNQNKNEWVIVLKGEAKLLFFDGTRAQLKAGDYINIPGNTKHKVCWTTPDDETVWLAIHY